VTIITIEKVSLVGAHDARAVDAYLAPIVDQTLIGTMSDWPAVEQASRRAPHSVPARNSTSLSLERTC
jgi:hypothetical protein